MTQPYVHNQLQQPMRPKWGHIADVIKWLVETAIYAICTPWAIVAMIGLAMWLSGDVSTEEVRSTIVGMATVTQSGWRQAAEAWNWYVSFITGLVVLLRICTSPLAILAIRRLGIVSDEWFKRKFPNARVGGDQVLAVMFASVVALVLLSTASGPKVGNEMNQKLSPAEVRAKFSPRDSVALQMKDGHVISGVGEITRIDESSYLVKLTDGGAK